MMKIAEKITFIGRVQGVGFRFTAFNIAKRNLITGHVRNLPDGSVEMVAQGYSQDIEDCINDLKDTFQAYIQKIVQDDIPFNPDLNDFKIAF